MITDKNILGNPSYMFKTVEHKNAVGAYTKCLTFNEHLNTMVARMICNEFVV